MHQCISFVTGGGLPSLNWQVEGTHGGNRDKREEYVTKIKPSFIYIVALRMKTSFGRE